jgi:threonine dehydrogenase-like Zn-dependent dehydrogenase
VTLQLNVPQYEVGAMLDGRPIEWVGSTKSLVYFGPKHFELVADRPIACTSVDVLARVVRNHRCGTDVKIYQQGRPDQCEESLFDELRALFGLSEPQVDGHFRDYTALLRDGAFDPSVEDRLYQRLGRMLRDANDDERKALWRRLRHHWGRVLGHETIVTIVRAGSEVQRLHQGIGYLEGHCLSPEYLDFQPGRRCVLQSRVARYDPPRIEKAGVRGVQLLGGNITDLAMNQAGAYSELVRLRPEMICSGSVVRIPDGVPSECAALAEPTACLLDCFEKTTHELGQDDTGSILRKGVLPGGAVCIIGSGSMALMAAKLAIMEDPIISIGGARQVVMIVRSEAKSRLVRRIVPDERVMPLVCGEQSDLFGAVRRLYGESYQATFGKPFRGFDDVILACGTAETFAQAHRLIGPGNARIMAFAGTRGGCQVESGLWHYNNAGIVGTSGCNTKMIEIALGLFARGSLNVSDLAGKGYTFDDLAQPGAIDAFFNDKHLRPYLSVSD